MDTSTKTLLIAAALTAAALAQAQGEPPPGNTAPDPAGASSPHQRAATGAEPEEAPPTGSPEASAASTPHQHSVASEKKSGASLKMAKQEGAVPATFVKKATLDGMAEVELGKTALANSHDEKIRQFANRMITDHTNANEELASLAQSKHLDVPKALDSEHQSMLETLSAKSGAAFDAAYREHMNQDHREAIALFEGASQGKDPELAALAKKTLPTLQEHKRLAEALPQGGAARASTPQAR
jgi:putative membrane protein